MMTMIFIVIFIKLFMAIDMALVEKDGCRWEDDDRDGSSLVGAVEIAISSKLRLIFLLPF
mgnify:CR=1 FL=1